MFRDFKLGPLLNHITLLFLVTFLPRSNENLQNFFQTFEGFVFLNRSVIIVKLKKTSCTFLRRKKIHKNESKKCPETSIYRRYVEHLCYAWDKVTILNAFLKNNSIRKKIIVVLNASFVEDNYVSNSIFTRPVHTN